VCEERQARRAGGCGLSRTEAHRREQIERVPEATLEAYIATQSAANKCVTADEVEGMVAKRARNASAASSGEL